MSGYRFNKLFPKRNGPAVFTVIHAVEWKQVLRNVEIAQSVNADGAYIISHGVLRAPALIQMYLAIKREFPKFPLGINLLDMDALHALDAIPDACDALWFDDASITDRGRGEDAHIFLERRKMRPDWRGLSLGGVAFKGQKRIHNVAQAARNAMGFVDVITTSGPATGRPPTVKKIRTMREAIGDYPFANASGMTIENIGNYAKFLDAVLVGTGISSSFTQLDRPKTLDFIAAKSA